jgi:hypothetical protein
MQHLSAIWLGPESNGWGLRYSELRLPNMMQMRSERYQALLPSFRGWVYGFLFCWHRTKKKNKKK